MEKERAIIMTKKKEEYYKISKSQIDEIKRFAIYANYSFSYIGFEENLHYDVLEKLANGLAHLGIVLNELAKIEYEGLKK